MQQPAVGLCWEMWNCTVFSHHLPVVTAENGFCLPCKSVVPAELISSYLAVIVWRSCSAALKPQDMFLSTTGPTISEFKIHSTHCTHCVLPQANCYYHGEVEGHINSDVSLSTCAGVKYVSFGSSFPQDNTLDMLPLWGEKKPQKRMID